MDLQRNLLLNFTYFHQDKNKNMNVDEVRQSVLANMELEAQAELKLRDEEIAHLKDLLAAAIRDRDEAQDKCHKLILLQQRRHHSTPHSGVSSLELDEDHRYNAFSSSDCDESIVSSPHHLPPPELELPLPIDRPLPEKGKFLQAVMKAGPLLQTLLLAGPLPQWRHPPPPLDTYQIPPPPVVIPTPFLSAHHSLNNHDIFDGNCGAMNRKRGLSEISSHSAINNELKYQRVVLQ